MKPEHYPQIATLIISSISLTIAILSYSQNEKTRKLAVFNFRKQLMDSYIKWRDELGVIELDPPPGTHCIIYTEPERRKIRNYWPKVALIELELLKSVDRRLINKIWIEWERYLKEGIGHRSVLQEFCYYERNEDKGNTHTKDELVKIVREIYRRLHNEEINTDKLLEERSRYTK